MDAANDSALRELFETEANDELDGIERLLDRIGEPEAAGELYRHAHTIKGSAAVMGLDDVAALAATLESIFDRARCADGDVGPGGAAVIRAAVADLRYIVSCRLNQVDVGNTVRDAHTALRALHDDLHGPAAASTDARPESPADHATANAADATTARLDALSDLIRTVAAAQVALMRLLASSSGVTPDDIPEYRQLAQRLGDANPGPSHCSARRSALVVEDSALACEHHRRILADAGFEVRTARDGADALTLLRQHPADVVVTDLEMPQLDGIALTRAIRSSAEISAIPVIIVTSRGDDQTRQRSLTAGAQDFLVKTVNADTLVSSVAHTLEKVP